MPFKVIILILLLLQIVIVVLNKRWLKKFFVKIDGFGGVVKQGDLQGSTTIGNYVAEQPQEKAAKKH